MNNEKMIEEQGIHKLLFLSMLFGACLLAANITAVKLFSAGGLVMTAGIIMYPVTFLLLDSITEVWGRKTAQRVIWTGLFCNIVMIGVLQLTMMLTPADFWPNQEAYEAILGSVPRMVLASLVAYIISQSFDVTIFTWIKKRTQGKHLWLRSNASTMVSQLLDSIVFMFVAFLGVMSIQEIFTAMFSEYLIKIGYTLFGTPLVYLLVKWARSRKSRNDSLHAEQVVGGN